MAIEQRRRFRDRVLDQNKCWIMVPKAAFEFIPIIAWTSPFGSHPIGTEQAKRGGARRKPIHVSPMESKPELFVEQREVAP
jgi:hypothetical protein